MLSVARMSARRKRGGATKQAVVRLDNDVDMALLRRWMRGRVPMHVRQVKEPLVRATNYNQLMKGVALDKGKDPRVSFLNELDHFKRIKSLKYEVPNRQRMKYVDGYLQKLSESYHLTNKRANKLLNSELKTLEDNWIARHGKLPKIPNDSNISQTKKQHLKEQLSAYNAEVRQIKDNQPVTVYSVPGGTNFDYLTNCIKLLNSDRAILFSIDIEAFEFDTKIITEIGISIYDPRENLYSTAPITRNYHLIVSEVLQLRNSKFVCDYKDCYLLGESFVMPLKECCAFVQALLNYYMKPSTDNERTWSRAFVGHNIKGDIKWLKDIGVDFRDIGEPAGELRPYKEEADKNEPVYLLDTEKLYCANYGRKGSNLGRILQLLEIPHAFLHNAGNDAHYTLELLKRMCDVQYRELKRLDDLEHIATKIEKLNKRAKEEPKILPMSYAIAVANKTVKNFNDSNNGKKRNNLVQQTEFGGATFYNDPKEAFLSTFSNIKT
ncbi:uncharacterized protein GVI51_K05687 [Nakaseomyces glabratus]|uniref:Gfd2/YDR514C-like C-terminal domain-containing protein n=2 Tax=Candida glabrata TaxID=5478 RepID=Q6FMR5_CANGA|nr:uncharacterized protein CAGL0K05819g [Nakaseomyces glabratus]KAH7597040.1 hypothetical protein J7294_03774 [Nakaseomyces glabratus]KAH7602812.1 hypothetical protein J7293_03767 [Nakaseomyces glabratus]KAI8394615.1 hypothetical protein J6895_03620 [Nakaseomyces glabratus]KAJ9572626.1 hypothetical protein LTX96_0000824 [Nakaseomyces glabratus]OXB41555.1 hypothetical protein B1J91_K05819g [Nakaseomyces glabratus]|eukprot:XP_448479.1 uncharacterized protein CAGL0K05819g [[Candida] glabrata]